MTSAVEIFSEPHSTNEQLDNLHLTPEQLKIAILKGQAARNNATPNHPANAGGTMAFFEVVRGLRDELIPKGWKAENTRNLSMTVFP